MFLGAYVNGLVAQPVIDEGGNSISVRYTPLTASSGNYHLEADSPAVDAAVASYIGAYPGLAWDIDGQDREAGAEDLGADEFRVAGDVNCDGTANGADVAAFLGVLYGGASACGNDDVNEDGFVDFRDLIALLDILR